MVYVLFPFAYINIKKRISIAIFFVKLTEPGLHIVKNKGKLLMVEKSIGKCIKMEEGSIQEHVEKINNNGNLWIDIEKPTRNKIDILGENFLSMS